MPGTAAQIVRVAALEDGSLRVGFIGAGNMATAIITALLKHEVVGVSQLLVTAPSDTHLAPLRERGISTTHSNDEVLESCHVVFLCVKPHVFPAMVAGLSTEAAADCRTGLFISIMAGLSTNLLHQKLTRLGCPCVVRAMPNTPCLVAEGCCVYTLGSGVLDEVAAVAARLLGCLGGRPELVRRIPEAQIDAAAAIAGCGPAYFYVAIEALADGGVKMGLPRDLAMSLAAGTVRGAGTMVLESGKHPGQLKDEVCSPGGTTIAAIHALEKNSFRNALMDAVEAATKRAKELGTQ